MDVRLPNGVTVKNVPPGITQEELKKLAIEAGYAKPKDFAQPKRETHGAAKRFAYGASEPITGLAQMAYNAMPEFIQQGGTAVDQWLHDTTGGVIGKARPFNEAVNQQEAWYQSGAPEGMDLARMGGNIATGVVATRGMGAPTSLGGSVAQGAAVGAGMGAAAPVYGEGDYWAEKGQQAATGGAVGAALGPVGYGIGRMISPKAATNPDVRMMREAGVNPTIGGTLGGTTGRLEQMSQSVPIYGDKVAAARMAAREQFNRSALNQAAQGSGKQIDDIGTAGVEKLQQISDDLYKTARNMIPGFRLDNVAKREIAQLRRAAKDMKPDEAKRLDRFFENDFYTRIRKGGVTTESFKRLDSEIGKLRQSNKGTELDGFLKELESILNRQAERASPEYRQALRLADEVFKKRVILESATNSASGSGGVFTPKQLLQAAKTTDKTVRKNQAAAGKRPFQDFAQAGSRVIGDNYPESGTAGRLMTGGLLGGGVVADPTITALSAAGLYGAGSALYGPAGQNLLRYLATVRPQNAQAAANEVSKFLPLMTPALMPTP